MKKIIFFLALVCVIGLVWYASHKVQAPTKNDEQKLVVDTNLVTMVDLATTFKNSNVIGTYPQFKNASANFNKKIADFVNSSAQDAITQGEENWQARLDTATEAEKKQMEKETSHYSFQVEAKPILANDSTISVALTTYAFVGGAHGSTVVATFNYDVKNKKEITLASIFANKANYLKFISDEARKQLTEMYTKDEDGKPIADKDTIQSIVSWIETGTEPSLDNFQSFTFTDKNVTIYFQDYQVGPHAAGMPTVTIPRN